MSASVISGFRINAPSFDQESISPFVGRKRYSWSGGIEPHEATPPKEAKTCSSPE
jgi:hypothetical protein